MYKGKLLICQFGEDNYKQCLNYEVMSQPGIFIPSQPQENTMGFDAAFFSSNPRFWRLWESAWTPIFAIQPREGVELSPDLFDGLQHDLDENDFPAKFKANIFMQYKRPDYLSTSLASEYDFWREPYFRYCIDPNQQNILEQLETNVSNKALVVYACPAFWKHNELLHFSTNGAVMINSNFAMPDTLHGHHKYTFVNDDRPGKALSEPTDIPKVKLPEKVAKLKELSAEKKNSQFIKSLSAKISQIVEKTDEPFKTNFNNAKKYFGKHEQDLADSISQIHSFLFITNLSWFIVY